MKKFTLVAIAIFAAQISHAQYCMLPGRTAYSTFQPGITNFQLGTINRTSSNVEHPLSQPSVTVTTDTAVLRRGQTYTVTIKHTRDSTSPYFDTAKNNIRVWIDYNNDKDFDDAGETVISADFKKAGVFTGTFTVPVTTPIGIVRLRATAKMSSDAGHTIPTPCDEPKDPIDYHGEIEDYTLRILPALSVLKTTSEEIRMSVYPNPANGVVNIAFDRLVYEPFHVSLHDITGKLITEIVNEKQQTSYNYSIDMSQYNTGVYYLRVISGSNISYQRLVKTN